MNTQELESRYGKGIAAHKAGRLTEAEAIYSQILKQVPNADAVLTNMSALQYAKGNVDQGLRFADKALKVNPINLDAMINRATCLLALGQDQEARAAYEEIVKAHPNNETGHYNLANLYYKDGSIDLAEQGFRKAISLKPDFHQALFNLANILVEQQKGEQATSFFERALAANPTHAGAHHNLAATLAAIGDWAAALRQIELGLELVPNSALLLVLKGRLLGDLGDLDAALDATNKSLAIDPSPANHWVQKGNLLRELMDLEGAKLAFERALLIEPTNEGALRNLKSVQAQQVPGWHFPMLADTERNRAYDRVLRKHVREGDRVLDIGTGSGLLSMMAARAGATEVIACERESKIAEVARTIIDKNGYSDRIKVFDMDSRRLRVGKEVPDRVDLIVSEIVDVALLGEGMLPSIRAALRMLAKPDARVIPAKARVWVQLLDLPNQHGNLHLGEVEGFDLSLFEQFRQYGGRRTLYLSGDYDHGCSEVQLLREFDFSNPGMAIAEEKPEVFQIRFEQVALRQIEGLLLWFELELDEENVLSSGPGGEFEHWGQAFYPLNQTPYPGEAVTVECTMHDMGWRFQLKLEN
ncbi:MAG: tetratricopeptide repeat protein [Bacteroidia bacterium]